MTAFDLTRARICRTLTNIALCRIRIVGTKFGIRESILRKSRGWIAQLLIQFSVMGASAVRDLTLSLCSPHRSDLLNRPELVLIFPRDQGLDVNDQGDERFMNTMTDTSEMCTWPYSTIMGRESMGAAALDTHLAHREPCLLTNDRSVMNVRTPRENEDVHRSMRSACCLPFIAFSRIAALAASS